MQVSMPTWVSDIEHMLPEKVRNAIGIADKNLLSKVDELRLRANKPMMVVCGRSDWFLTTDGRLERTYRNALRSSVEDVHKAFEAACQHSIYACEEELRMGFVTVKGGYRVGISGKVNSKDGEIYSLAQCSGLCIRISREIKGCANAAMRYIRPDDYVYTTLIVSPPMMGKTTILRDAARQLADGYFGQGGKKVCVVDERGEIAGSSNGIPQLDVGIRTDVLDACPKAIGMMMALRSLSPEVIITDEIGGEQDAKAIIEASFAGVKVIATAHGLNENDVMMRKAVSLLAKEKTFERYIILGRRPGHIVKVLDSDLKTIAEDKEDDI